MKNLLYLYLFLLGVASLAACGGDDPAPVAPDEPTPADTTPVDSMEADTTRVDSVATDSVPHFFCEEYVYSNTNDLLSCAGGTITFSNGESTIKSGRKIEVGDLLHYEYCRSGYVCQQGWLNIVFPRILTILMQPVSVTGWGVWDVSEAQEDIEIQNDARNRENTNLMSEARIPAGCIVRNADYYGDIVSLVTFWPAACRVGDLIEGHELSGAVAGVAVTPLGASFSKDVDVQLTFPLPVEGYGLSVESEQGEGSVMIEGRQVAFSVRDGAEWTLMMGARIVGIEQEERLLLSDYTMHSENQRMSYPDRKVLYQAEVLSQRRRGYEAETELNFLEERFLESLFGSFREEGSWFFTRSNRPCTVRFNVVQTVYHITFEAAGRRFRAAIYGFSRLDILEATPDEE